MAAVELTKQTLTDFLAVTTLTERVFVPCAVDGNLISIDDKSFFEIKNEDSVNHTVSFATKPDNWGVILPLVFTVPAGKTLTSNLLTRYFKDDITLTYDAVSIPGTNPSAWLIGTTYVKDNLVYHASVAYKAIEATETPPNIAIEPGVTSDWASFWAVYAVPVVPVLKINIFGY